MLNEIKYEIELNDESGVKWNDLGGGGGGNSPWTWVVVQTISLLK